MLHGVVSETKKKKWDDHCKWVMSQSEASIAHVGVINVVSGTSPRDMTFYDDVTGALLDTDLVLIARAEEMAEFRKHGIYKKVKISECHKVTGKPPVGVRWIDINKGDDVNPDYRSRLVATSAVFQRGE